MEAWAYTLAWIGTVGIPLAVAIATIVPRVFPRGNNSMRASESERLERKVDACTGQIADLRADFKGLSATQEGFGERLQSVDERLTALHNLLLTFLTGRP